MPGSLPTPLSETGGHDATVLMGVGTVAGAVEYGPVRFVLFLDFPFAAQVRRFRCPSRTGCFLNRADTNGAGHSHSIARAPGRLLPPQQQPLAFPGSQSTGSRQ